MSFIKLSKNYQEYTSLVLRPDMFYISSSAGIIGSQYVEHIRTNRIKDYKDYVTKTTTTQQLATGLYYDVEEEKSVSLESLIAENGVVTVLDPENPVYLSAVNNSPVSAKFRNKLLIKRIEPGKTASFSIDQSIKNTVRKNLCSYYKSKYPDAGWSYSNYHTINFFKDDELPDDSCLIYPNHNQQYTPTSSFSLSFHINPRYDNVSSNLEFDAGTIFHMSSSIAVSLVSGSVTDQNNLVTSYKLLIQLSQSADIPPSSIDIENISNNYPNDLIYVSDFELAKNTWNHVMIRWSPNHNNSSGSIIINDKLQSFYIPSSSLCTENYGIVLGNYYDGENTNLRKYFNQLAKKNQGIEGFDITDTSEPPNQSNNFTHPLQAEIHNIMLFDTYLNNSETVFLSKYGVNNKKLKKSTLESLYSKLIFYVPPYFVPTSPSRSNIVVTPYEYNTNKKITTTPYNVDLSYSLGINIINLENFVADFSNIKNLKFPRLQSLTASVIDKSEYYNIPPEKYVYESSVSPQIKKRNLTILPNDNGLFSPDYFPVAFSTYLTSSAYTHSINSFLSESMQGNAYYNYTTFYSIYDYSKISLENMVPFDSQYHKTNWQYNESSYEYSEDLLKYSIFGSTFGPYNKNTQTSTKSTSYDPVQFSKLQRYSIPAITKDVSSNEVIIFDISQLYYGNAISDMTFSIIDSNLTGSNGKVKIRLKDNGKGSLYRANSMTPHAKWNNVGDIINEEGIVTILSPHLNKMCKDKTNIYFKGEQTLHTMILNIPVVKEYFNSSSNSTYVPVAPTTSSNDAHLTTKYISAVNIHDNNFNIIMKAHFAQPIIKTEEDEFVIRLKQDF